MLELKNPKVAVPVVRRGSLCRTRVRAPNALDARPHPVCLDTAWHPAQ